MTTAKTVRWLDLIAFLLDHRFPVTREQIFAKVTGYGGADLDAMQLETARRKFERDKDELRAVGIEIETIPIPGAAGDEPQHGYRLRPSNFYLPYLDRQDTSGRADRPYSSLRCVALSSEEIALIDRATRRLAERTEFPLSAAATSARRKLAFDLPLEVEAIERVLAAPMSAQSQRALEVLQQAVADRFRITCRYHVPTGVEPEQYSLDPYGLFFQWSYWFCVARGEDSDVLRVLRVDRMTEASRTRQTFEVPESFDVRSFMVRAPWELGHGPVTSVRVRFVFPEARWVVNSGVGRPVDALLRDGGAVVEFRVRDREGFLRWLLTFRRQAAVVAPPDVADDLETLRRRVAALYEAEND